MIQTVFALMQFLHKFAQRHGGELLRLQRHGGLLLYRDAAGIKPQMTVQNVLACLKKKKPRRGEAESLS